VNFRLLPLWSGLPGPAWNGPPGPAWIGLLGLLWVGLPCVGCGDPAPAPPAALVAAPATPALALPAALPPAALPPADAAAAYAACRARVEEPEADGECTTDADCAVAGCSGEICTTAAAVGELMSTCEVDPCFAVLDHCGCQAGRCSWSLKGAASDKEN